MRFYEEEKISGKEAKICCLPIFSYFVSLIFSSVSSFCFLFFKIKGKIKKVKERKERKKNRENKWWAGNIEKGFLFWVFGFVFLLIKKRERNEKGMGGNMELSERKGIWCAWWGCEKKVFIFFFGIDYLFCFKYDVIEVMLANAN